MDVDKDNGGGSDEPQAKGPAKRKKRARRSAAASGAEALGELAADELAILPVRSMVLFPGVALPMTVGRPKSLRAIEDVVSNQTPVGLLLQRDEAEEDPGPDDVFHVGTSAEVVRFMQAEEGGQMALCQGQQRFRVVEFTRTEPYLVARVEAIPEPSPESPEEDDEVQARFRLLKEQSLEALKLMPGAPEGIAGVIRSVRTPGQLADLVTTFMDVPAIEKQELLETIDLRERLEGVGKKLGHLMSVLELSSQIRQETRGALDKAQRDYYLREQLKQIRKELGDESEGAEEIARLREAIEASGMSEEAASEAKKELARLERMPQAAAEYSMIRTWLETLVDLPWDDVSEDELDLAKVRKILDDDHHGLEKVKERIIQFLAVRKLNPTGKSPILCLVGPPGVGKTSLGHSIARATGREFVRLSLGGVHDEAEIRGHRRTYIGAMPGSVIQSMRKAGTINPVFMLDEMDKLGAGMHGDPSAAMLEVLDPEQNDTFRDNYLNVPFDLGRVMFIATANVLDMIPGPLRDRLEIIYLPGYVPDEKLAIAKRYLVPKEREACGLKASQIALSDATLKAIIHDYTREAGVRGLRRQIGSVMRYAAAQIASNSRKKKVKVGTADLLEVLGPVRYEGEVAMRTSVPGVATGLAWTAVGGEILFIEATAMPGRDNLILTGQLGDVMRESALAALSLVKNRAERWDIEPEVFQRQDIHIHLPAGAIPKDGPSAGVTMYVALISLLTGRTVDSRVAMTGEISLRGLVLPVGGIREKVLAALDAGIRTVLIPARNEDDLAEVPQKARDELEFIFLETVDDAIEAALSGPKRGKSKRRKSSTKRTAKRAARGR